MIQDISPNKLNNQFINKTPKQQSIVMAFCDNKILVTKGEYRQFPQYSQFDSNLNFRYLFSIDGKEFFLLMLDEEILLEGYEYQTPVKLRWDSPKINIFAMFTAYHLYTWYRLNKFCGACGSKTIDSTKERMLFCEKCGNMIYPRLSPAIIVGVTHGDKILLTKYSAGEYKRYALVAGFCEIGETAEETVAREVMEEVGVKVKNIRYYKSQPWGITGGMLLGYFAELDGEDTITIDLNELSEAVWVDRENIDVSLDDISLTNEMICVFKDNKDI